MSLIDPVTIAVDDKLEPITLRASEGIVQMQQDGNVIAFTIEGYMEYLVQLVGYGARLREAFPDRWGEQS